MNPKHAKSPHELINALMQENARLRTRCRNQRAMLRTLNKKWEIVVWQTKQMQLVNRVINAGLESEEALSDSSGNPKVVSNEVDDPLLQALDLPFPEADAVKTA